MAYRAIDRATAQTAVVAARRAGKTLAAASATAGIHPATACRWQSAYPAFADALREAATAAGRDRYAAAEEPAAPPDPPFVHVRPRVPVHPDCPACGRPVEVRRAWVGAPFWRCSTWPACRWASWRPRSPWACRACGGPTVWSHRRVSIVCTRCGDRETPACE